MGPKRRPQGRDQGWKGSALRSREPGPGPHPFPSWVCSPRKRLSPAVALLTPLGSGSVRSGVRCPAGDSAQPAAPSSGGTCALAAHLYSWGITCIVSRSLSRAQGDKYVLSVPNTLSPSSPFDSDQQKTAKEWRVDGIKLSFL